MSDPINIVREVVNLEAYSESRGWLGYFERTVPFKREMVAAVQQFICQHWGEDTRFSLVTSLFVQGDVDWLASNRELDQDETICLKQLVSSGWIKSVEIGGGEHVDSTFDVDAWLLNLHLDFRTFSTEFSQSLFRCLLLERFSFGHFNSGHCFLVLADHGLVLYPHDDTGFGVIAMDIHSVGNGYNFLRASASLKSFEPKVVDHHLD